MPRPQIDESLANEIKRLHRETQGESAGSIQEALDTVVQLAGDRIDEQPESTSTGWYPGKYAEKVVDQVIGSSKTESQQTSQQPTTDTIQEFGFENRSLRDTLIFKSRVSEDRTITLPKPEVDAVGVQTDDLLQVVIYPLGESATQ